MSDLRVVFMLVTLLHGQGKRIERVDDAQWRAALAAVPERMKTRLAFMSPEHHTVRYFVVRELPRARRPLTGPAIAAATKLPPPRVDTILEELHRNLFFLVRNDRGEVTWAFPVTTDRTRHALTFSSGERLWGA